MKVLHVIDSGGLYGAEQVLLNLCAEQSVLGVEAAIASIGTPRSGTKPLEAEARRRGIRVEPFRMRSGPNCLGALRIVRFARDRGATLLHSHGYRGNILLGTLPPAVRRLPLIATVHGYTSLRRWTRMKAYEWLDARLLRFLDAVVLVDYSVRSHPSFRGAGLFPFRVVRNGIGPPPEGSSQLDPDLCAFCQGGFTVGAVGRLSPEKGFDLLIEAVWGAWQAGAPLRLVIFGEGGERARLQRLVAERGLAGQVLLPGYLPDVRRYLPFLQAFVLSSLTEGVPMTVLEAMQAEIPVLATQVGAVPEILEHGEAGLLVPPGSAAAITVGLLDLCRDPELGRRLAGRAAERVRNCYSSRRMALQYCKIYRSVLDRR